MPAFLALVRPNGAPVADGLCATRSDWSWHHSPDRAAALGHTTENSRTTLARCGDWTVVGSARLDDRPASSDVSDIQLIATAIATTGASCIRTILGDFAFVAYSASTREVIAARDAFGVKSLYYRSRPDELAFSSHATPLSTGADYDLDYIAEFILSGFDRDHRTPWRGVTVLPPGHILTWRHGATTLTRYWSAAEFQPADHASVEESCFTFRSLLERAIISNLSGADDTWSQLSGGLDSSSLVALTETMRRAGRIPHGIAGAVMMADSLDDESSYARAVSSHYGVRHEEVRDYWLWQDDGEPPPHNDLPDPLYPMYARNRAFCSIVRSAGGKVLFSGVGPDHFLAGNLYFFADSLAKGHLFTTARELWRWSLISKKPFWKYAFDNALAPLLPSRLRQFAAPRWAQVYDWITPEFAARLGLNDRTAWGRALDAPLGRKFAGQVETDIPHLAVCIDRGEFENSIDMRFPYLYRPFVELCLRLPRDLRIQSATKKWIMRESLKGVLPEVVRTRRDKGAISGRTRWALGREAPTIKRVVDKSILADLGCISATKVRQALERSRIGDDATLFAVTRTLALECWLQVHNYKWQEHSGEPTDRTMYALAPAG